MKTRATIPEGCTALLKKKKITILNALITQAPPAGSVLDFPTQQFQFDLHSNQPRRQFNLP